MKKKSLSLLTLSFFCLVSTYTQEVIFPEIEGQELLDSLVRDYKTINVLDYGEARDFMYGELDNVNDTVRCIYTGHSLYLPADVDPSTFLHMAGSANGINAEHAYPQSKGACESCGDGNARSDMHHLFPTRAAVNSARGNKFFGEVADNLTTRWYWMDQDQPEIPIHNIDEWSEGGSQVFEPRESVKGNIARAMMYFYTMYKEQADEADDFFFDVQRVELCEWHALDPVDLEELVRTASIGLFQDDKPNPFVLDCTIAERTYCSDILAACQDILVSTNEQKKQALRFNIYPNPSKGFVTIDYELKEKVNIELVVYDLMGKVVQRLKRTNDIGAKKESIFLDKGFYFITLSIDGIMVDNKKVVVN